MYFCKVSIYDNGRPAERDFFCAESRLFRKSYLNLMIIKKDINLSKKFTSIFCTSNANCITDVYILLAELCNRIELKHVFQDL